MIVVRDFAQLRISLAFSFFILALVQKNRLFKFLLVFVSLGIHKSLLVIVVSYFLASKISRLNAPKRHTFLFFMVNVENLCSLSELLYDRVVITWEEICNAKGHNYEAEDDVPE